MRKHLSLLCLALIVTSIFVTVALLSETSTQNMELHVALDETAVEPSVSVNKTASIYEITCGQEVLMNLTVTGTGVGEPVDVMLVIDCSGSMGGEPLDAAKDAAKSFVDKLSFTGDPYTTNKVGVVSHSDAATLDQGLTDDPNEAKSAIDNLQSGGATNIMAGVHEAQSELETHGRDPTVKVIILLSDGVANRWTDFETGITYSNVTNPTTHTMSTLKAIEEAVAAKDKGTTIFTIGLNLAALGDSEWVARDTLERMATSSNHFFDASTPGYLEEVYGMIAKYISPVATDLRITDIVEDEFIIVADSFNPTSTSVTGNTIIWEFDALGNETRTFQYKIRPIQGLNGTYPTNVEATLDCIDHEGNPAQLVFPIPTVRLHRVCVPAIQINKTANPTVIFAGERVVYTYEVTNKGPYPLRNINVTDDQLGHIAGPFNLEVGETKTFTGEDYPTADVVNVATAQGKDPWNYTVSDTDDASIDVIIPGIKIEKTADPDVVYAGESVTFTYTVTNIGDDPLTGVNVTDDVYGDISGPFDLSVGDYRAFSITVTVTADVTNIGNATGWDSLGNPVSDTDEASVYVITRPPYPRTIGFWKHQVYVYLFDKATAQVTEKELLSYLEKVSLHSNYTRFKELYVYDNDQTLSNAHSILWCKHSCSDNWMKTLAEKQLLATWLNVVSSKLSWGTRLDSGTYGSLRTVGEAITYCENLLKNGDTKSHYEEAKTICDNINNGLGVLG